MERDAAARGIDLGAGTATRDEVVALWEAMSSG
jgi:hypothetical protein